MTPLVLAVAAAYGVHLGWTGVVFGWQGLAPGDRRVERRTRRLPTHWLDRAGLDGVRPLEFAGACCMLAIVSAAVAAALFGTALTALVAAAAGAAVPLLIVRERRRTRAVVLQEAWPRLIEEIRVLVTSVGRSVPQALFEAARHLPDDHRRPFEVARREWLLTTNFDRTTALLRERLADPAADAALETLVVAHEIGGSDLDRRLADLAEDRRVDLQHRRDARAGQAGVRFARRFVLIVPLGMAIAGSSIGQGRAAYGTPGGQAAVAVGMALVGGCWWWAGRIMRLPTEARTAG